MRPAVLLDLDGTLVTFEFDVKGSRLAIMDLLKRHGFDVSSLTTSDPTQKALDLVNAQISSGRVSTSFEGLRREIFTLLDGFERDSSSKTVLFGGTLDVLRSLRVMSVRTALLTNSGSAAADRILRRYGIGGFFEFVLTRDDGVAMKPDPAGVLEAVSRFSVPAASVWYVGDSVLDVWAAKAAGVRSVSVATGNYSADRLKSEGADVVLASLSELPELVAT